MLPASETSEGLVEFAFESRMARCFSPFAVLQMTRQVWSHNMRTGITGRLVIAEGRFGQVIEGAAAVVLPLAARILSDDRHHSIRIDAFGRLEKRRFPDWRTEGLDTLAQFALPAEPLACPLRVASQSARPQALPSPIPAAERGFGGRGHRSS